ncbi:sodium:proton antiporter, partial [Vibrio vulnificus]
EIILVMTYAVVVFSILVQGSTITPMIEKAKKAQIDFEEQNKVESESKVNQQSLSS